MGKASARSRFLICKMRNLGCMISQVPLSSVTSVIFPIPWHTYWLAIGLGQRIICPKGEVVTCFVILPESLRVAELPLGLRAVLGLQEGMR